MCFLERLNLDDSLDDEQERGVAEQQVRRWRGGSVESTVDQVGQEWPVALVFNGISHAVMMCTPRELEAFAVGFAISEGIVERGSDIRDIEVVFHRDGVALPYAQVELTIVQQAFAALKERRRARAAVAPNAHAYDGWPARSRLVRRARRHFPRVRGRRPTQRAR